MPYDVRPTLEPVLIGELRPTQMTVGKREVALKRQQLRALTSGKAGAFLGHHFIPVVLGPKRRYHIVDHHHLALALYEENVREVFVWMISDLSALDKNAFLVVLDNRSWMHPFDASGKRCAYADLPKSVNKLADDPYRSLAGAVRRLGGYAKDPAPFAEFLWADYFRRKITLAQLNDDFDKAAQAALHLATQAEANYLPGWCGPED